MQLGRPSGIQDRDIDVEMPLNIDVEYTDAQVIFDMQTRQIEATKGRVQGDEYAQGYETITSVRCVKMGCERNSPFADDFSDT